MTDDLRELLRLAGSFTVQNAPSPNNWEVAEAALGLKLHPDFKELVSAFGDGIFGELYLRNPVSWYASVRMNKVCMLSCCDCIRTWTRSIGVPLYPVPNGYLSVGSNSHGMSLFMRPVQEEASRCDLLWHDLDENCVRPIKTSLARFLADVYLRRSRRKWMIELREIMWEPDQPLFVHFPGRAGG